MSRYIIRNGEKLYLSYSDELMLLRQSHIIKAKNTLENFTECTDAAAVNNLSEDDLASIGEQIETDYMSNMGDREYSVLERFGLINA